MCVCWIFAAMMADEQQTLPEYKKREMQLCDGFAVCGRSYFRRSAFSRVHLFFLLPWEGPQVIGWIPLCTICTWPNVVHPLVQHTQGLPEYKKGGQKMSATMSISSSCLSRERQWVFRAFIYIRFRTMPKSLSGSSLFLYYYSSALSLSFILAITIRVYIFSWCPATQKPKGE